MHAGPGTSSTRGDNVRDAPDEDNNGEDGVGGKQHNARCSRKCKGVFIILWKLSYIREQAAAV